MGQWQASCSGTSVQVPGPTPRPPGNTFGVRKSGQTSVLTASAPTRLHPLPDTSPGAGRGLQTPGPEATAFSHMLAAPPTSSVSLARRACRACVFPAQNSSSSQVSAGSHGRCFLKSALGLRSTSLPGLDTVSHTLSAFLGSASLAKLALNLP